MTVASSVTPTLVGTGSTQTSPRGASIDATLSASQLEVIQENRTRYAKYKFAVTHHTYPDCVYEGEWSQYEMEGSGRMQYPSGSIFEGDWSKNQPVSEHKRLLLRSNLQSFSTVVVDFLIRWRRRSTSELGEVAWNVSSRVYLVMFNNLFQPEKASKNIKWLVNCTTASGKTASGTVLERSLQTVTNTQAGGKTIRCVIHQYSYGS